jgi:hypothetical protein
VSVLLQGSIAVGYLVVPLVGYSMDAEVIAHFVYLLIRESDGVSQGVVGRPVMVRDYHLLVDFHRLTRMYQGRKW